jgi:ferritin-like metal-binding protein YciE
LQQLAKQAASQAQKLQEAEEGLQLSLDQKCQIQEAADLQEAFEKLKAEHKKQIDLLQTRVDTLGKDKSVLEERSNKLQEKNKNLVKENKGNSLVYSFLVAT